MQHGYMMQGSAPAGKDKPGLHQGFGAYHRIVDPEPWTEMIWNDTVINIDEIYQSPHLQRYIRNEGFAVVSEGGSLLDSASYPDLPDSDPLSTIYNAVSVPSVGAYLPTNLFPNLLDEDQWAGRRSALVQALAYKAMVPTIGLSTSVVEIEEPVARIGEVRSSQVVIKIQSNRVYSTDQEVTLGIKGGAVNPATYGSDYNIEGGLIVTIPAGQQTGQVILNINSDDDLLETDETIALEIIKVINKTPYGYDIGNGVIGFEGRVKADESDIAITIKPGDENEAPIVTGEALTLGEGGAFIGNLLSNDTDPDGDVR